MCVSTALANNGTRNRPQSNRVVSISVKFTSNMQKTIKIISGGQAGVDRGALDAAIALKIPHGGWCPRGRIAEDGPIPKKYRLEETDSTDYTVRTEKNVVESDATLIFCRSSLSGGTLLTYRLADQHGKPCKVVDLNDPLDLPDVLDWIEEHRVAVLNVAGPRESQNPGIATQTRKAMRAIFRK
jgi:hypothetical protein